MEDQMSALTHTFRLAAREALADLGASFRKLHPDDLTPLNSNGLAHDHLRIGHTGWLLRVPRGNQLGLGAEDYLRLQYDCFTTAAKSKHVPRIKGYLAPAVELPHGALIVEEIKGQKSVSGANAKSIATALAALHKIEVPSSMSLLQVAEAPFASQLFLLNEVFGDAPERGRIDPLTKQFLQNEQTIMRAQCDAAKIRFDQVPQRLIGGDCHPANFLITEKNRAILVDPEFATFDMPYIDLADASLPITQRLDPDVAAWSAEQRELFYKTWAKRVDPGLQSGLTEGRKLAERAVKLRTLLWLADWTTKTDQDRQSVTPLARYNWDRMASVYLDPTVARRMVQGDIYPALAPVPQSLGLHLK